MRVHIGAGTVRARRGFRTFGARPSRHDVLCFGLERPVAKLRRGRVVRECVASLGAERHAMMKRETFAIANIYVPVKRRKTLDSKIVQDIASSMLEVGQTTPILVRQDGGRLVLVEGLHRLEACKALGEETIVGYLVDARKH